MRRTLPPSSALLAELVDLELFDQDGEPHHTTPAELEEFREYAAAHVQRFRRTLEFLPRSAGRMRVLELGASPFLMTWLMRRYLGYEVVTTSFDGDYGANVEPQGEATLRRKSEPDTALTFEYQMFNLELDPYPYGADSFDVVVCCEILEHLAVNPSHLLAECHRVLVPDGRLVLTTPNSVRWENVIRMLRGRNPFDPYSGLGVYGRHNREYTAGELERLLAEHNFEARVAVEDAYDHGALERLVTSVLRGRRDNLFVAARAFGEDVERHPDWLYRGVHGRPGARSSSLQPASADPDRLGPGWLEPDRRAPHRRWTGREATAWLVPQRNAHLLCVRATAGPTNARGHVWIDGIYAGGGLLPAEETINLQTPLPAELARDGGRIELKLVIENPFVPDDSAPGTPAHVEHGVAVERIWLV